MGFFVNKSEGLPLLRGKIHLYLIFIVPLLMPLFYEPDLEREYLTVYMISFICCFCNFAASATLHYRSWSTNVLSVLRRIDYAGIFLMIGGSGLPSAMVMMNNDFTVLLVLLHWIVVLVGAIGSLVFDFCKTSKPFRVFIYCSVSGPYFLLLYRLYLRGCYVGVWTSLLGILSYGLGGLMYAYHFPEIAPGIFGYHEMFHLFCVFGLVGTFSTNLITVKNRHIYSLA
ncbi:hypothetical protein BEWA_004700 [Theileria equi strain WA]|uniref:Hemolysin III n=1 Tax=Theileria equi strain WA TaxID=1537102 RepID=L0AZN8_THEEQ|nr:hypothetical protein BEWA_004700 [Theileria equi strain WA]AFZ81062.1 hypothetical protein BEWA_004700 [Theileria equi strain WA]|eukprot:XP_004830728.1 hypothetical protein BEWA_004700 [Theileria equi strain WA]